MDSPQFQKHEEDLLEAAEAREANAAQRQHSCTDTFKSQPRDNSQHGLSNESKKYHLCAQEDGDINSLHADTQTASTPEAPHDQAHTHAGSDSSSCSLCQSPLPETSQSINHQQTGPQDAEGKRGSDRDAPMPESPSQSDTSTGRHQTDDPFTDIIAAHHADLRASKAETGSLPSGSNSVFDKYDTNLTELLAAQPSIEAKSSDNNSPGVRQSPSINQKDNSSDTRTLLSPASSPTRPRMYRKATAHLFGNSYLNERETTSSNSGSEPYEIGSMTAERGDEVPVAEQPSALSAASSSETIRTVSPPASERLVSDAKATRSESPEAPRIKPDFAAGLAFGLLIAFVAVVFYSNVTGLLWLMMGGMHSTHLLARLLNYIHQGQRVSVENTAFGTTA